MENLGINSKLLLAQIINFLLFFYLVKRFIVKPFLGFLENEKKQEKEKEIVLAEVKKAEEKLIAQEARLKERAKKELDLVLEQAKQDGKQLRVDMLKQAEIDAEEIKTRMKKQFEEEKEKLYKDVRQKIGDVSMYLVTEGLKESLDTDTKKKVTQRILKNLSSAKVDIN